MNMASSEPIIADISSGDQQTGRKEYSDLG